MAGYYIPLVGTPQIGEGGGGGGSDLPAVTAADNGDVLTVVNGAWDKAAPSGGGVLVVHNTDGTLDKTWQEIYDAMISGGAVYAHRNGGMSVFVFAGSNGSQYHVDTAMGDEFYTATTDGYPQME